MVFFFGQCLKISSCIFYHSKKILHATGPTKYKTENGWNHKGVKIKVISKSFQKAAKVGGKKAESNLRFAGAQKSGFKN